MDAQLLPVPSFSYSLKRQNQGGSPKLRSRALADVDRVERPVTSICLPNTEFSDAMKYIACVLVY